MLTGFGFGLAVGLAVLSAALWFELQKARRT